jgi:hypothetical protein
MVDRVVVPVMTVSSRLDRSVTVGRDGSVMTRTPPRVKVQDMSTDDPIRVLVLEEFRLYAADLDGTAARIVANTPEGIEPAIPLLTSIEDNRNVATLRALHAGESTESDAAQHAALDPLVSSWAAPKHYGPRITERSQSPPSSFRLAVTESGINAGGTPRRSGRAGSVEDNATSRPIGLLWIGAPVDTHAGLLLLLGSYGEDPRAGGDDPFGWPLPLSTDLGVRIYENSRA